MFAGLDGELVVVGSVEYGIRDGICGGVDNGLVVVESVEYGVGYGTCGAMDGSWSWWELWSTG